MADHLTDEEQLQQLKNWWKDNGTSLIIALLLGLIAYFGFQWWQNYQKQQAEQASVLYAELVQALEQTPGQTVSEENKATANYLIEQLEEGYASTQYTINAKFLAAKIAVEAKDLTTAEQSLQWVVEKADKATQALAQLRLARVYVAQEKYDEALALVDTDNAGAFTSFNAEVKGDILAAKSQWSDARAAYQQAIDALENAVGFRSRLLPIKLANLPVGEQ